MNNASLINQTSGDYEYYTPMNIIEAARQVMGSIDLDPASSLEANKFIKAGTIFAENGLDQAWFGNIWLNHPFSRKNNPLWIKKLMEEFDSNVDVKQCCCITYAATSESWFGYLTDYPMCFLAPRTNYMLPDGTVKRGVTKGSVVTYLGNDAPKFTRVFGDSNLGWIKN